MKTATLRNGQTIWALNDLETALIDHEIFAMQSYSRHGITIADGDCIFDVGANIGLYSLYLAQSCSIVRVFAFEPVPEIFAVLQRNIQTRAPGLNVELLNVGLSDKRGGARFEFDPASSLTTTMRPGEVAGSINKKAGLSEWLTAGVLDMQRIGRMPDSTVALILKTLSLPIINVLPTVALLTPLIWAGIRKRLLRKLKDCTLTTVSDIIREHHLDTIHLLKIDVEGSERAVIDGIEAGDWPKIRQFVVEVHDTDGRVEAMQTTFERHGYRTVIDQEDWALHKLLGIFTLYAVRD